MNRLLKFLIPGLLVFFVSCSTEKNTMITRSYHNLTSHYNIYFNGYESFNRGIERANEGFVDNYTRVLPLFYYTEPSVSQSIAPDMDRALEKSTKVITLHSITAKPEIKRGEQSEKQKEFYNKKEYNKWIDENYLLMGKAYVYKNEFELAIETFRKVVNDFPNEPTRYNALVWMARSYNELGEYRESEKILEVLEGNEEVPEKLYADLYATHADLMLKQEKYEKAAEYLEKALNNVNDREKKIRYSYILAQLYQMTGNSVLAVKYFREVIKMNPPYEMTFNAKISMASSFEAGSEAGEEITEVLKKMLRDDKNIEYQDQIYYAMGEIAMKEGDRQQAIEYYRKSVRASLDNYNQKGLSYLALGDIYYNQPDYSVAQAYYDSTLQNIDPDYDRFEELSNKAASLNELVEHVQVYELEDSVQTLAALPEAELFARIDQIIEDVRKKEEEERLKEQEGMLDMQYSMMNSGSMNRQAGPDVGSQWYFYNQNAKGFGQPEFRMKWGNRKLEDNWRRKSKQTVEFNETPEEGQATDTTAAGEQKVFSNKEREFYLQNIPMNDSAMEISHQRLEKALYNMGLVYRFKLKDMKEAIWVFEEQLDRYPDGPNSLMAYYNLYELYDMAGDVVKSKFYKDAIIRKYPDSPRAKILQNPDYIDQMLAEENKANNRYEKIYNEFEDGRYQLALDEVNHAINEFEGDDLIPRFKLLRALSIGGLEGKEAMKSELDSLIAQYPSHEVSNYARELIDHIYSIAPELEEEDTREEAVELYSYDPESEYFAGIAAEPGVDVNQLNFNMINFNLDNFNRQNLSLEKVNLTKRTILVVRSFKDQETARIYLSRIRENEETVFNSIDKEKTDLFIISPGNYTKLLNDKDMKKYLLFYEEYFEN